MSKQDDELDLILDDFHKSKPADTPTYNLYHERTKQRLLKYIEGLIPEKKLNDTSSLGLDQIEPEHHERNGYNQAIDEIRRRAGIGGDKNG